MNPASLIGKTIGQYEIEAVLGQGGMGAVFRAVQLNLRRRVAVKVILENLSDKPDYLERFNREAQLVAALEHPHIVTVYDFGMEYVESVGDVMFVAMRLLEGGSLEKRIRQREGVPQTLDEVADLVSGICSALDHAHSMGVIHRDIKPANIVFDRLSIDAKAYLVDFGIAKTMGGGGSLTNANVAMGSPYYMPPEQWKNEAIKPASDQYALAITIYNILTGRLPFEADSTAALMYKHLQDDPTPIQNIRPNLPMQTMMVLGRAMAKNPDDRWPTCTAFAEALRQSAGTAGPELTNPFINTPMGMEKPPTVAKPATVAHRPVSRPMRSSELANLPQTGSGANARRTGSGENLELSNYMIPNNQPIPLPPDRSRVIIGGLVGLALVVVFIIIGAMLGVGGGDENATATAVAVAAQPTNSPQPSATLTASLSPRQVALATRAVEQTLNAEFTQIAQLELTETAAMFTATPTATHTPTATDTPTRMPTNTPVPPTDQPSATPVPPTDQPSATPVLPTLTPTETPLPPSATPVPPTATLTETPLPPSATPTPTETPIPPTATPTDLPSATPAPTDVPAPTAVPVSMIATDTLPRLFEQDFSAQAEGLVLRVGNPWEMVDVGGDRAYCNTNSDPAASNADIVYWGDAAWDNYVVQARIRFDAPTTVAELYGRYDTRSTLFSAYLNAPNQVANLGYFTPDGGQGLGAKAAPLTPGQWYTVRLELDGATVRYWLDGALMVESIDSARPLTPGYAAIRVASGQRVCIDDITVWGFSAAPVVETGGEPVSDVAAPGTVSRVATSDLALLFEQDFTGNATTGFSITQGNPWDTILIQGDTAYCNRANPSAADGAADILTFGSTAWEDYIVELDVFFADVTAVEVYTRYNSPNRLYSAFLHGGNQNAVLAYFDPQVETPVLGAQPYNFARNQRYTVRIELVGDSVRYWLGDQLMVENSSIDRWGAGGAAVRVPSRSRICVDNVRAWSYTEPTGAFYATLVASSANLRTGPGTSFASAGALVRGDRVIVVARNGSSEWLRVRTPYGVEAWLAASLVDFEGSLNTLPVQ